MRKAALLALCKVDVFKWPQRYAAYGDAISCFGDRAAMMGTFSCFGDRATMTELFVLRDLSSGG